MLEGLPAALNGSKGPQGGSGDWQLVGGPFNSVDGGAPGEGGAGLSVVCRGINFGAGAVIDVSGADGSPGVSGGGVVYSGSGGGGAPGACLILFDGPATVPLFNGHIVANYGDSVKQGTRAEGPTMSVGNNAGLHHSYYEGKPTENAWLSAFRFAFIPASIAPYEDYLLPSGPTAPLITGYLTNESHTVATDSAGNGADFSGAGGSFIVYENGAIVTPTYSVQSEIGVDVSINSSGVYSVVSMSADIGVATLRAVYNSTTIDKTYSISKSRAGTNGAAAQLLYLSSTAQTFTYDTAGNASPSSQTITFTANLQNLSGTAAFTCTLYNSANTSIGTPTLGGTGNSRTLTDTQFAAAAYAKVVATLSGFSDTITVVRIKDGAQGVPGVQGPPGADGSPRYTWIKYADNASGGGMSDVPTNKYYIGIAYNKTTPTESNTPGDYEWSLYRGSDGVPGATGADGQTYWTWIKYADNSSGGGMSDDPTGKAYFGIAHNKTTPTESTNPGDYSWSLVLGPQGNTGPTGPTGPDGLTQKFAFIRSASQPATPSGSTYPPSGWSVTHPAGTDPVWMTTAFFSGATISGGWSTPTRAAGGGPIQNSTTAPRTGVTHVSEGGPVEIKVSYRRGFNPNTGSTGNPTVSLKRNGTTIATLPIAEYYEPGTFLFYNLQGTPVVVLDTPGSGSFTYLIELSTLGTNSTTESGTLATLEYR